MTALPAESAGLAAVPALGDAWVELRREIDRSRRYRHPVTLIRVVPDESSGHSSLAARVRREGRPGHRRRDPVKAFLVQLRAVLRSGDSAWSDGASVFVLLPETDASGAQAMVARVRAIVPAMGDAEVHLASFPEHGLTSESLRAAVTRRERRWRPPIGAANGNGNGVRGGAPLADLEWRVFTDRLPGCGPYPPGGVPEAAD